MCHVTAQKVASKVTKNAVSSWKFAVEMLSRFTLTHLFWNSNLKFILPPKDDGAFRHPLVGRLNDNSLVNYGLPSTLPNQYHSCPCLACHHDCRFDSDWDRRFLYDDGEGDMAAPKWLSPTTGGHGLVTSVRFEPAVTHTHSKASTLPDSNCQAILNFHNSFIAFL